MISFVSTKVSCVLCHFSWLFRFSRRTRFFNGCKNDQEKYLVVSSVWVIHGHSLRKANLLRIRPDHNSEMALRNGRYWFISPLGFFGWTGNFGLSFEGPVYFENFPVARAKIVLLLTFFTFEIFGRKPRHSSQNLESSLRSERF